MRIVRWAPSERVDIPDITAMSFLVLGEFRRTQRALLSGEQKYIVNGFAVEPESPATTRVQVRLQPPGEDRGVAIGAEQTTAGLDHGQLIGDRDSSFINEGASQQFLDFAAQPPGPYTVEMRFTYADGVSDNRAFWNAGTASEFVAITNTRHVSGWQIRFVSGAPSGGEWIPLATVTWDGVAVDAADIADLRVLLFEGAAPYSRATQTAAGGVEDFDRSTTRAAASVGRFRLREVVRALMRQVQDLKGPNDSGVFDWFSRIYKPFDPDGALSAEHTKTLRSIDTVTYTIGDGVSTFGDFNGASGLEQCLDHIEAMVSGSKPERIEIVLHGGTTYTITTPKNIQAPIGHACTITLRAGQAPSQTNVGLFGRPRISIDGTGLGGTYALIVGGSGGGNLILRGLDVFWSGTTAGNGMFATSGYIEAYDCQLQMSVAPASPDVGALYVLSSPFARKCRVSNCFIRGRVQFYDLGDFTDAADRREHGLLEHSRLEEAHIVLHTDFPGVNRDVASGFTIRNCAIEGRTNGATYTSSTALIDGRSASYLTIEGCEIVYGTNENGIDGRTYLSGDAFMWRIRDCNIFAGVSNGSHGVGAGQHLADGTGWAINLQSTTNGTQGHVIENVRVGADGVDAGAIRLYQPEGVHISKCEVVFSTHGAGGTDTFTGIQVHAAAAAWLANVTISDTLIHKWLGGSRTRGIRLQNVNDVKIRGCTLRGDEFDGTDISGRTTTDAAVWIDDCDDVKITDSHLARWNYGQTTSACIYVPSSSVSYRLVVAHNTFEGNGNYAIHFVGGAPPVRFLGPTIIGNSMSGGADSNNLGITLTSGAGNNWSVIGNTFVHNTGVGNDFIFFNNMGGGICSGNESNADIRRTGATLVRGYKPDDDLGGLNQNLNSVNAYT